jgi:hypothetical protein
MVVRSTTAANQPIDSVIPVSLCYAASARQLVVAIEPAPAFLRRIDQLEHQWRAAVIGMHCT